MTSIEKKEVTRSRGLAKLALLAFALAGAPARVEAPAAGRTEPAAREQAPLTDRVVIISIDGLGPDVLKESFAPNLRSLMAKGSYTLSALTTETVKTLPSHVSMLTGVTPEKHGVLWNDAFHGYPKVPTLMEVVKRARPGLTTALVAGKPKFRTFLRSGVDWSFVPEAADVTDADVARQAAFLVREHQPNLLFVHLPNVDQVGHAVGWGSLQQRAAVSRADAAVGRVLDALRGQGLLDQTAVIVTADHGGVGRNHEPGDAKSIRIPWLLSGPGVRRGFDLSKVPGLEVHTEDTFATASWLLGVPLAPEVDGRPVACAMRAAGAQPSTPRVGD